MMEINVRVNQESALKEAIVSTWDGRNMARCNDCGVLYDHRYAGSGNEDAQSAEKINCPECGSLNAQDQDICSYCEAALNANTK
jgi:DNA-directed RNA polymerase subunit RPC12/RpoP